MIDRYRACAVAAALALAGPPVAAAQVRPPKPFAVERSNDAELRHPRHGHRQRRKGRQLERRGERLERGGREFRGRGWERKGDRRRPDHDRRDGTT